GAFSGALAERKGLFASAHGGTIFLDDVNDIPATTQPKLLDVLQRGRIRPVGSDREAAVDVRVIAASNRPLKSQVEAGQFRADLYYRLDVIHLQIPSLHERLEDLEPLMLALAERHKQLYHPIHSVQPELIEHLRQYPFPGNVRELEHIVQRMLFAKSSGSSLTLDDLDADSNTPPRSIAGDLRAIATQLLAYMEKVPAGVRTLFSDLESEMLQASLSSPLARGRPPACSA